MEIVAFMPVSAMCISISLNIKIAFALSFIHKHDTSRTKSVRRKMTGKLSLQMLKIRRRHLKDKRLMPWQCSGEAEIN